MSVYRVGRRRRKRKRSSTVVLVPQLQHARLQVLDVNCLALAQVPESLEFSSLLLAQIPDRREAVILEQVKLRRDAFHALLAFERRFMSSRGSRSLIFSKRASTCVMYDSGKSPHSNTSSN
jgi:hypothetical protein